MSVASEGHHQKQLEQEWIDAVEKAIEEKSFAEMEEEILMFHMECLIEYLVRKGYTKDQIVTDDVKTLGKVAMLTCWRDLLIKVISAKYDIPEEHVLERVGKEIFPTEETGDLFDVN